MKKKASKEEVLRNNALFDIFFRNIHAFKNFLLLSWHLNTLFKADKPAKLTKRHTLVIARILPWYHVCLHPHEREVLPHFPSLSPHLPVAANIHFPRCPLALYCAPSSRFPTATQPHSDRKARELERPASPNNSCSHWARTGLLNRSAFPW